MSVAAVLALSLLATQSAPASHEQAVTCTGVFVYVYATMSREAETSPGPESRETAAAAGRLLKAADDDRLAAARREGLGVEASGQRLQRWLDDNIDDPQAVMDRELDACLQLYMDAI